MRLFVLLLVLLLAAAVLIVPIVQKGAKVREFRGEAIEVLKSLQTLDAGLDVGYTLAEYRVAVRDIHSRTETFRGKYGHEPEYLDFCMLIDEAVRNYIVAGDAWENKLKGGYFTEGFEMIIQDCWADAKQSVQRASACLQTCS